MWGIKRTPIRQSATGQERRVNGKDPEAAWGDSNGEGLTKATQERVLKTYLPEETGRRGGCSISAGESDFCGCRQPFQGHGKKKKRKHVFA